MSWHQTWLNEDAVGEKIYQTVADLSFLFQDITLAALKDFSKSRRFFNFLSQGPKKKKGPVKILTWRRTCVHSPLKLVCSAAFMIVSKVLSSRQTSEAFWGEKTL